jgi:hypothetical protein
MTFAAIRDRMVACRASAAYVLLLPLAPFWGHNHISVLEIHYCGVNGLLTALFPLAGAKQGYVPGNFFTIVDNSTTPVTDAPASDSSSNNSSSNSTGEAQDPSPVS